MSLNYEASRYSFYNFRPVAFMIQKNEIIKNLHHETKIQKTAKISLLTIIKIIYHQNKKMTLKILHLTHYIIIFLQ